MRRIGCFIAFYALCLGTPIIAAAQEPAAEAEHQGETGGIENMWDWSNRTPPPFGYALINFVVFVAIMGKLAWPSIRNMVKERHDGIAKALREAAELHKQAEDELKQYQSKVAGIDQEIETLLTTIRKEAEQEKARIIAAAEADAKRLKLDAERQIAAEIDRARRELRRGVVEAAVAAADEALRKNIGADDQRKMAERYVGEVELSAKQQGRPA
jgi:F-type H+-transporting ATPase subunit b